MKTDAKLHVRENRGLLAIPEKKALNWLAGRMPQWINSDHLTLLGLFAMIASGASFWVSGFYKPALFLIVFFLAVNWFGDSLDGTLARFRDCQRPRYGYYVDHVIDLIGTSSLLCGMALSGYMRPMIAIALLATFALVEAEVFLSTHVQQVFRLSRFGFGPTELRILLAIGTLYLFLNPSVRIGGLGTYRLFDVGGVVAIAGLAAAFMASAIRNTHLLYQAETRKTPCSRSVARRSTQHAEI